MSFSNLRWHHEAEIFVGADKMLANFVPSGPFLSPKSMSDVECLVGFFHILAKGDEPVVAAAVPKLQIAQQVENGYYFHCQSGGTTGEPKILRRSCDSWRLSFKRHAQLFSLGTTSRYAILGRLEHSLALFAAVEGVCVGANVHLLGHLRPKHQARIILDQSCDVIYATPTQILQLVAFQALDHLKLIFIGGGRLSPEQWDVLAQAAPLADLRVFYGASETSFVTLSDANSPLHSVGKAYPDVDIEIRNADIETGIGEIWVRSPYLFENYTLGTAQDTVWDGEWLTVGEMGRMDSMGNLFLSGRKTRMFTVADQNIFPEDIERSLMQHPEVSEAVVLAIPDRKRGYRPVAFYCGSRCSDVDLRTWCRSHMSQRAVPFAFHYITTNDWPRLASGKTNIRAFSDMLEQQDEP